MASNPIASIGHLITRLVSVAFGFAAATLAASIFLSLGMVHDNLAPALNDITGETADLGWLSGLFGLISWPWVSACLPAALPSQLQSWLRWRGLTINLVIGAWWGCLRLDLFCAVDPRTLAEGTILVLASAVDLSAALSIGHLQATGLATGSLRPANNPSDAAIRSAPRKNPRFQDPSATILPRKCRTRIREPAIADGRAGCGQERS
ncbi:MAG: hypothetical protein R3D29_06395 [Nitratireductor sp.]